MRLTVLGCLGSEDVAALDGTYQGTSSYLVETDSTTILLDAGFRAHGQLKARETYPKLDAIFITHLHEDHMADLVTMAQHLTFVLQLKTPIPLFGPQDLDAEIRRRAAGRRYPEDIISRAFAFQPLEEGRRVEAGEFGVTPHRVNHRGLDAHGLRVDDSTSVLGYSGDTGKCEGLLTTLDGVDLALVEGFDVVSPDWMKDLHLSGAEAGEEAARAGAKRLVVTHMKPGADTERILADAGEKFPGPVEPAVQNATYLFGPVREVSVERASRVLAGEKVQLPGRMSAAEVGAMSAAFEARFGRPPTEREIVNARTR